MSADFDLLVVGGGINGVGIARDAAGRGLRVLLCEKGDLAGATSSASSKLIHGGLRYLEHYEFRLVRESLAEREVLLRMAPHLVEPLRFVLPHGKGSRPRWMVRAGLFLYDRLGGARSLPGAASVDIRRDPSGAPLRDGIRHAFLYSDCRVDDARLTVLTARDAAMRGAEVLTRTRLVSADRQGERWRAVLDSAEGAREVKAHILVNAAGPWVMNALGLAHLRTGAGLRLVKGSHIVVPRLYDSDLAYVLQNDDGRIVFVIPYERDFTLIGTTELPFDADPGQAQITPEETAYLCRAVARWFRHSPTPGDVVWSFAGVRPLYDNKAVSAGAVTRDYVFELDENGPPALSVFGGKLTTYRRLAEHALEELAAYNPRAGPPWTARSLLPGGAGLPEGGADALAEELRRDYPEFSARTAARLAHSYGSEARLMLADGAGRDLGNGLSEAEIRWLVEQEWARSAVDILWRRTKLGLYASPQQVDAVQAYLAEFSGQAGPNAAPAAQTAGQ